MQFPLHFYLYIALKGIKAEVSAIMRLEMAEAKV